MNITYIFMLTLFMCFITFNSTRAATTSFRIKNPIFLPRLDLDAMEGKWYLVASNDRTKDQHTFTLNKVGYDTLEVILTTQSPYENSSRSTTFDWKYDSDEDVIIQKYKEVDTTWKIFDKNFDTHIALVEKNLEKNTNGLIIVLSREKFLPPKIFEKVANAIIYPLGIPLERIDWESSDIN